MQASSHTRSGGSARSRPVSLYRCGSRPAGEGPLAEQGARQSLLCSEQGGNTEWALAQSHRLRIGRWTDAGRVYMVTVTCYRRRRVFDRLERVQCFVKGLQQTEDEIRTWCWVAMPDHVHLLIQTTGVHSLSYCVQKIKSCTTRCLRRNSDLTGSIWQSGFHDRAIRRDANLKASARYIVANPLRAGLVDSIGKYPFWDAAWIESAD